MAQHCFQRIKPWSETTQQTLPHFLNQLIKYDVPVSVAILRADSSLDKRMLDKMTRPSDTVLELEEGYFLLFYQYTDLEESHFAIKNLYTRLLDQKHNPKLASTLLKATDKDAHKLLYRLCDLLDHAGGKEPAFFTKNDSFDSSDIDFSDL